MPVREAGAHVSVVRSCTSVVSHVDMDDGLPQVSVERFLFFAHCRGQLLSLSLFLESQGIQSILFYDRILISKRGYW